MTLGNPSVQIAFHVGLHCTDSGALMGSLRKNAEALAERKIIVPAPRHGRRSIGAKLREQRGSPLEPAEQQELLDTLTEGQAAERVVVGNENLLCQSQGIFARDRLYGLAGARSTWLRNLFPDNLCEFFIGVRNPATFIPALMQDTEKDLGDVIGEADPLEMRWSDIIEEIKDQNPDSEITVWCNEDTPLIWPTLLREVAGVDDGEPLEGELDLLESIMKPEGFERMKLYLQLQNTRNDVLQRRIFAAFLGKFAIEDEVEEAINIEGWTDEYVDQITDNYDRDVQMLEQMPGINFIGS